MAGASNSEGASEGRARTRSLWVTPTVHLRARRLTEEGLRLAVASLAAVAARQAPAAAAAPAPAAKALQAAGPVEGRLAMPATGRALEGRAPSAWRVRRQEAAHSA